MRRLILSTAILFGLSAAPALAMEATQTVEREVVTTLPDGTLKTEREPAELVKPGDRIVYTLAYVNTLPEAAPDVSMAMPIPAEVRLIEGTEIRDGAELAYSADGGQTFTARADLSVQTDDGRVRPATADDITHVRWTLKDPVASGEAGAVSFKGRLR